jgi:hypothetical protein
MEEILTMPFYFLANMFNDWGFGFLSKPMAVGVLARITWELIKPKDSKAVA